MAGWVHAAGTLCPQSYSLLLPSRLLRQSQHCTDLPAGQCRTEHSPCRLCAVHVVQAKQAFVGSESSTAAATTQQQQQQLSSAFQPSNADSSSSSIGQQAAPVSPAGASGTAVNSSHPQSPPLSPAVPSWESWCAHFEQQDVYGTRLDSLAAPLAAAVAAEDYTTAAAIKAEMNELVAADAVAEVQSRLSLALAEERYGDAAGLRDQGWALLAGWWACMSPLNPRGHLLHIYPE